jgi:hypothetical protein
MSIPGRSTIHQGRMTDNGILKGHAEMITAANDLFESFDLNVRPWHASRKPYFVRVIPMLTTGRRFNVDRSVQA